MDLDVSNNNELKKCPFCNEAPNFPESKDVYGTQYEFDCDCGTVSISKQICDYMTIEERIADNFENHQYGIEYIERARNEAIKQWQTRAE